MEQPEQEQKRQEDIEKEWAYKYFIADEMRDCKASSFLV